MPADTFNSGGTWTVPAGITVVQIECWGPGGAGAVGGATEGGGGGGGGGYSKTNAAPCTPSDVWDVLFTGNQPRALAPGPLLWCMANYGQDAVGSTGGAGGTPGSGDSFVNGSAGANFSGMGGGNGGAAGNGGAGGAGGSSGNPGSNGVAPGGGGGGGGAVEQAGGVGAAGRVVFTYYYTATLTGTAIETLTSKLRESDIVAGGKTIIITLAGDTWVASGATFDAQRQNIIDGLDSAQAEAAGWDAEVKANLGVSAVVRTSDTVVTITLDAEASYNITATETITVTVPATALTAAEAIVATPTFRVVPDIDRTIHLADTGISREPPPRNMGDVRAGIVPLSWKDAARPR